MRVQLPILLIATMAVIGGVRQTSAAEFYEYPDDLSVFVFYPGSSGEFWPQSNLIQGPGVGFEASDPHDKIGGGAAANWVTTDPCGFPADFIECADGGTPIIELDLGQDRLLDEISTWGYEDTNTNGAREFELRFATEADGPGGFGNSINFNPSYIVEEFDTFTAAQRRSFEFDQELTARYIELTVTDNYFDDPGDGTGENGWGPGGDRVGMGEIAFRVPGTEVEPPPSRTFYPIDSIFAFTDFTDLFPSSNLIQGPDAVDDSGNAVGFSSESPHAKRGGGAASNWVTQDCTGPAGGFPCDYLEWFEPPEIVIDLGEDVELDEINIWGYDSGNANGASEFELRFATDAEGDSGFGQSITYNPTFTDLANSSSARQVFEFDESVAARYVEVLITDNFFVAPGDGSGGETPGGDRVGLGEIAFPIPSTQVCGDFDMDGDVDVADRTIQTVNWTGAGNVPDPPKTFADGDCDDDGDVDVADQTGTIQNWTGAMAGNLVDGDDADLVYHPATGNVTLSASDVASGELLSFVFATDQDNMRPENAQFPFINTGTNTDAEVFQIGQTDALNLGAGPTIDLGDIFPPGIANAQALSEYLTLAEYASDLGAGGTLDLHVIPEPSGLALALFGLLVAMGFTRQRRR